MDSFSSGGHGNLDSFLISNKITHVDQVHHIVCFCLCIFYIHQIPKTSTILQVILVNSCNNVVSLEKWALSYRHFEHKDTDTNMFVER